MMNKTRYRHAEIRGLRELKLLRYVIVKDGRRPSNKWKYYTGDHGSPEIVWSADRRDATLYAEIILASADLLALREGLLPEGRRGVRGKYPYSDPPLGPNDYEDQPR
jgi:hypothetical protein